MWFGLLADELMKIKLRKICVSFKVETVIGNVSVPCQCCTAVESYDELKVIWKVFKWKLAEESP
jgi:hypothetical protein